MKKDIVKIIREKFIENFDEGLLLSSESEWANIISDNFKEKDFVELLNQLDNAKKYPNHYNRVNESNIYNKYLKAEPFPEKKYLFPYLAIKFLKMEYPLGYFNPNPPSPYYFLRDPLLYTKGFFNEFISHYKNRLSTLKAILDNSIELIDAETITENDLIFINVGYRRYDFEFKGSYHPKRYDIIYVLDHSKQYQYYRKSDSKGIFETFADIFIISSKYFIKLSIGEKGVIDRIQQIIQRDIKKLNIFENNMVEVFFHGHYDPETIVLSDYKSALKLQQYLTELRDVQKNNDNRNKQNRK